VKWAQGGKGEQERSHSLFIVVAVSEDEGLLHSGRADGRKCDMVQFVVSVR